jgi:hypothetical protein
MSGFRLGALTLADSWRAFLHPRVQALDLPVVPSIDCADCRMVRLGVLPARAKCCTYVPELPSFLVGEILAHESGLGGERVRAWVARSRGDPLFLYASPAERQRHRDAAQVSSSQALPCPLLEDGRCTIYEHRPYLCMGYHCAWPDGPALRSVWNALASLLALHSAIGAQFLMEALGLDREKLIASWERVSDENSVWTAEEQLTPEMATELWQGRDAADYYRACHDYVRAHAHDLRDQLDQFRRQQLLRLLYDRGLLSPERSRDIETQSNVPAPVEPPVAVRAAFNSGIVVFAHHRWTVTEHESYLLGLAEEAAQSS